jgi:hypothetical protein
MTTRVVHRVVVLESRAGEFDGAAQLLGPRIISSSSSEICSLPAIDGRKLITSTCGTTAPGVATTT